ncbi:uncharacterized protein METZ01_LOCUS189820, partial [marine metagenome]
GLKARRKRIVGFSRYGNKFYRTLLLHPTRLALKTVKLAVCRHYFIRRSTIDAAHYAIKQLMGIGRKNDSLWCTTSV